jgi:peptidoglycan/xylan/chitin deacetylase (PgdA/CDA1 family)
MALLKRWNFEVLELDDALERLWAGDLPPRSVVITIDDGFHGVFARAYPVLKKYAFPATVYITTFYAQTQNPVFDLTVQYMFWKTKRVGLDVTGLGFPETGIVSLLDEQGKTEFLWALIDHGKNKCDEPGRVALALELGKRLGVDYQEIVTERILTIMTLDQIRELSSAGFDIELHTHRHVFPRERDSAIREIEENRAVLEPLLGKKLVHFCYPSGIWAREQWSWLAAAGIRSAATCELGLNYAGTSPYRLFRSGDDEGLSQIEFEAEMYGFTELLRFLKRRL